MTTLTKNDIIISVSVLFSLIIFLWIIAYSVFITRHETDKKKKRFLEYRSTKSIYLFTFFMALAGSILMIIYSIDAGVPANSAQ